LHHSNSSNNENVRCPFTIMVIFGSLCHFLSAGYRREVPISGCLCKKQLDLFRQKLNILKKKGKLNFKMVGMG
jgi:hypothetical protein